jgi:multiple sugar transport system ATP-binding protein
MTERPCAVRFAGVTKTFGRGAPVLRDVDLAVDQGAFVTLIGPSGCGKSTMLNLVAGFERPTAGEVLLDGEVVNDRSPRERGAAMVFQSYALYPHLDVFHNIAFPLQVAGVHAAEVGVRVREVAARLGLDRLLERRPRELSGGQRQRVALGRALVRRPRLCLFDEPLSNLDAALRAELRVEIAALVRRLGVTSLYVTHDQVEAMTMGDRIAVLRAGDLQQVGPPRAIYEDPANAFVAGFLGSPPINWIDVERRGDRLEGAGAVWPEPVGIEVGERARAGLRAEHLRLGGEGVEIAATVVAAEPLGAETHVLLDAAGTQLRMKVTGFDAPRRGENVRVAVRPGAVLWFDASTGKRLVA